jgi:hypothetical protein
MKLNREEIVYGAIFGAFALPYAGFWVWITMVASGFLWAYGGAESTSKAWRRFGCPMVVCIPPLVAGRLWGSLVAYGLCVATLHLGYGIPTIAPWRPDNDEGSSFGRFFYEMTYDTVLAHIATRATIMVLLAGAYYLPIWWG